MPKAPIYTELFSDDDFMFEDIKAPVYEENFSDDDFVAMESFNGELDENVTGSEVLDEDLELPAEIPAALSESEIRNRAKVVRKGAKVAFGYVKQLKLDSKFAQGKFVKKEGKQYPKVIVFKVSRCRACTGVNYTHTSGAKLLHSTQKYQDKLAARQAAGLGGFGTNIHDSDAGLENILVTTPNGLKCILAYVATNGKVKNSYYISIDGSDFVGATKEEVADYMTPGDREKFLNPQPEAVYQSGVHNDAGENTIPVDAIIIDADTGERIKLNPHPINVTYYDPNTPYKFVFDFDKVGDITVTTATSADTGSIADMTADIGDGSFNDTMAALNKLNS